ncbi:surface-adhesin E family protein [Sulfurirhabdus autotrophica]|uniref:Surface-adhesin protein E-like domain-containing protein n=1 Tax=Sulfurirhabdus autotrophica TaxID=1706046 RepID=A0A4V2W132_9PROT|nr:surface-adhesin E family protein [Sulfurirhabdus autotrophica]TCV82719.1 hypothetical protein EDC63_11936 [Sulfurirhabdus autotrophica]
MQIVVRIFALSMLLIGIGQQSVYAEDWRPVANSNSTFDSSRVTRVSPSVIRVWERSILVDEALDYARMKGLANEYVDYSYSINLHQLDCGKQTHGFVSINNFNSRGAPTSPSTNIKDSEIKMEPAVPGTNADNLIKAVCDFANKRPKKR